MKVTLTSKSYKSFTLNTFCISESSNLFLTIVLHKIICPDGSCEYRVNTIHEVKSLDHTSVELSYSSKNMKKAFKYYHNYICKLSNDLGYPYSLQSHFHDYVHDLENLTSHQAFSPSPSCFDDTPF